MSGMKCPFCQQKLEIGGVDGILRGCPKCRNLGTEILWQELIRTRKALDIAIDTLKYANKCIKGGCVNWTTYIDKVLDKIETAPEQKGCTNG